jgi:DNA-binding CsgD family transcriptional regulator
MNYDKKNKEQLIREISHLNRKIKKLEKKKKQQITIELEKKKIEHSLQERVKELSCVYGIANLIERSGSSISEILQGTADLIPPSWQYPEITCARIALESKFIITTNFKISQWKQFSDITINREKVGIIEVYYLEKKPDIYEGPFLKEERFLIDSISERLGRACERIRVGGQLKAEQIALQNKNIALREILSKVKEEKKEISNTIIANVDKIITPFIHELENQIPSGSQTLLELLKTSLEEITSPFIDKISKDMMSLTPSEIQICHMIKNGLMTKEISRIRHISPATVSRHREKIRKKLGISNKAINLITYLKNITIK